MAKLMIESLHPIKNTRIETAFPFLLGWVGWIKKCFGCD